MSIILYVSACYVCTDNPYGESVIKKKCEGSAKRRRAPDQILVGLPMQNYANLILVCIIVYIYNIISKQLKQNSFAWSALQHALIGRRFGNMLQPYRQLTCFVWFVPCSCCCWTILEPSPSLLLDHLHSIWQTRLDGGAVVSTNTCAWVQTCDLLQRQGQPTKTWTHNRLITWNTRLKSPKLGPKPSSQLQAGAKSSSLCLRGAWCIDHKCSKVYKIL